MKINFKSFQKKISTEKHISLNTLKNSNYPIYIFGDGEYSKIVRQFLKSNGIEVRANLISKGNQLFIDGKSVTKLDSPFSLVIGIADQAKAEKLISGLSKELNSCIASYYFCLNPFYNIDSDMLYLNWDRICILLDLLHDDESKIVIQQYLLSGASLNNVLLNPIFPQYFPSFSSLTDREIVVDGGAYIGDTLDEYLKYHKSFHEYHAFEPSSQNFIRLNQGRNVENLFLYNNGLGLSNQALLFHDGDSTTTTSSFHSSTFNGENLREVQIVRLDDTIPKVSFIKLDIEGAELDALIGSAKLIATYKPKIAVCIYHKFEHLWQVIDFLMSLRSDYKFSVRYHSTPKILTELVLYAY